MKRCFKCGQQKDRSEFYPHPEMKDGLLGKCKTCAKLDSKNHTQKNKSDPAWVASERARCRAKSERARLAGRGVQSEGAAKRWAERNRIKRYAQSAAAYAERIGILIRPKCCTRCGHEGKLHKHHHDYTKPLDVTYLCTKCHGRQHWKKFGEPIGRKAA